MRKSIYDPVDRIRNVSFSLVRKVAERAIELEKEGHKVVHFQIGEPNFDTPKPIADATIEALNNNRTRYAPDRGTMELRTLLARVIADKTGLCYDPQTEIIVVIGGAEGLNISILGCINPGDEVIVFTPAFLSYASLIEMAGGTFVGIPFRKENGFQIDLGEVREKITPKTRMMIINNPSNPSGVVYDEAIMKELAQLAVQHDLIVLSDEVYDEILYDGAACRSIATYPGMRERTIMLNAFSKSYAMTGWRLGYVAADARLALNLLKMHQYDTTCVPTFIQDGVAKALLLPETAMAKTQMVEEFARRRKIILESLRAIPQFSFAEPKGAFYLLLDVSGTGLSGEEFAARLLEEKHVAVVPGIAFRSAPCFVRLSFAASEEDIRLGLERIAEFVRSLSRVKGRQAR